MKEGNILNSLYGHSSDYALNSQQCHKLITKNRKDRNHLAKRCHLLAIFICGVGYKIKTVTHPYMKRLPSLFLKNKNLCIATKNPRVYGKPTNR